MLLTALLTATTGAGATYLMSRRRRSKERRAFWVARLEGNDVDRPLETRHLSPSLAQLAVGARLARLALETPLVRYEEPWIQPTPWGARDRLRDYDLALCEARRAVWEWLVAISRLGPRDIEVLRQLQLDPRPLRAMVYAPGIFERDVPVFQDALFPPKPDVERSRQALFSAIDHLRQFEMAMATHRPSAYR